MLYDKSKKACRIVLVRFRVLGFRAQGRRVPKLKPRLLHILTAWAGHETSPTRRKTSKQLLNSGS